MTERIKALLSRLEKRDYRNKRTYAEPPSRARFYTAEDFMNKFRYVTEMERPMIHEGDSIGFNRSTTPIIWSTNGNLTPNYYKVITAGFDSIQSEIESSISEATDKEQVEYGRAMLECIDICIKVAEEHRKLAMAQNNERLYNVLCKIPRNGAESFYEACVFIKMCVYFMRLGFVSHLGLGRFDQYMYPFYLHDKALGASDEEIFEILEEFFISLNYDTDLYQGVQQGDNGQSMVLGGFDKNGNSMFNELSKMCLDASIELNIIDPKINLRVGKNTPDELYELGTLLTKQGLGFPQYCNDDVVIPGLVKLGYDYEDAMNYVVAACWEYIVPNCGADYPNIEVMDFPNVVNRVIAEKIENCPTFDSLMDSVRLEIGAECDRMIERTNGSFMDKNPLLSIFIDGCTKSLKDAWYSAKYRNYGCHGAGIANAADALAAVRKKVYDDEKITPRQLLSALFDNFEGHRELRNSLRACPKMGNNDDYVDDIAIQLMECFSKYLNNRGNGVGGVWRAGTGSAMEYIWKGEKCPATADGRGACEPYSSSFSPSLDIKTNGILSVVQSFTKYDMTEIINGGPLTVEIHDTVFRNDVGIEKVAQLVKSFVLLGGHQLQLNSINRGKLLDAQAHPEKYPNLIVRVWGWSGRFNELDKAYQDHIIRRTEYVG